MTIVRMHILKSHKLRLYCSQMSLKYIRIAFQYIYPVTTILKRNNSQVNHVFTITNSQKMFNENLANVKTTCVSRTETTI